MHDLNVAWDIGDAGAITTTRAGAVARKTPYPLTFFWGEHCSGNRPPTYSNPILLSMYGTFHNKVNDIAHSTDGQQGDSRRSGTRWPFDGQRKPLDSHHYVMFTLV